MADLSLKPISQLPIYKLNAGADYSDIFLVVSLPDSFNPGQYISRKTPVDSFITRVKDDSASNIQTKIDNSIGDFAKTLSGTVSNVLSTNLPASSIVVTNASNKLATSGVKLTELNMLSGCTANIKATFDLLQISARTLSTGLNSKYDQLTGITTSLNTRLTNLSNGTLPSVSSTLSAAILANKNILVNKIDTLSIEVDVIKGKYVDKDDNAQQLDQLSTDILSVVAQVSAALSTAIEQVKTDYIGKFNEVSSIAATNAKNIQFILDNLDIGVNTAEIFYENGQWQSREIKDKYGNAAVGYMFKLDSNDAEENEAVLLIGAGTPAEDSSNTVIMQPFNVDGEHSIDGHVNDLLQTGTSIEVDSNIVDNTISIKLNGAQQNIKFEQFMFLNIN